MKAAAVLGALALATTLFSSRSLVAQDSTNSGKFLLNGTAVVAPDPNPIPKPNPSNDTIKITTTPAGLFGNVSRHLGVKIDQLTDELEAKWYFTAGRSCGGGSPRIVLFIDLDGTGAHQSDVSGYFGPAGGVGGCPEDKWMYDDLTDELPRWDLSHLVTQGLVPTTPPGASGYFPWAALVAALDAEFPNHIVCSGSLTDDTFPGSTAGAGDAYYDIISIGDETLENRDDVAGRGFARGCESQDEDEGDGEDHDSDHAKFDDHQSQPQNSSLQYSDGANTVNLQSVNGVTGIAYTGSCVSFAGSGLVNNNPGYLFTFAACDLSAAGTGIGNFSINITGPLGFVYQKSAMLTSGFVSIHPQ